MTKKYRQRVTKTTTHKSKGKRHPTTITKKKYTYQKQDFSYLQDFELVDLKQLVLELLIKAIKKLDNKDRFLLNEILKLVPEKKVDFTIGVEKEKDLYITKISLLERLNSD